jgi:hypothetical protein
MDWMVLNQLARRNLSDIDRVALALQLKPMLEEQARQRQGTRSDLCHNCDESPQRTDQALADLAGVSRRTVHAAEQLLTQGAP